MSVEGTFGSRQDRLAYSLVEVAHKLGLGLANVRRLVRSGELGSRRVGRRLIVPTAALERFLES
jgi:excisionase family DNA binding protein